MTPAARAQAAIEVLDNVIAAARDNGPAADTLIADYFRTRRYAGSKDRRAVRDLVYDAIRRSGERPASGRAAMLGLAGDRPELGALFDGSVHGPAPIAAGERPAGATTIPAWIEPLLAAPVERAALLGRAPLDLRVNRLKATREGVAASLPDATKLEFLPDALRLPEGFAVEKTEAWMRGEVEIQDAGSQLIALACAAEPGMTVVDLCAGAGGKTLALAAAMADRGRLIAADVNRERLRRLTPRAKRAGVTCVETLLLDQGREAAALTALAGSADVVLVDAPCSGSGTWRRNPEARWRLTPDRLERLASEQARILDLAAPLVHSGGAVIYAVCGLTDREGRDQIAAFTARHNGWRAKALSIGAGRPWGEGCLLTPGHDGCDGFFVARIEKS